MSKIANKKVSIIVPCYNQAEYLSETLDSVLAQTHQDWECIIVNDGSPDNTEDIAKKYVAKDVRFKYYWKENGGVSAARNFGIIHSDGEFILPLDADDFIDPTYLEKAVNHFYLFPETTLVYCKADTFGVKTEYWDLDEYDYNRLIWENCIFCTAMFRRVNYDDTSGYNVNMVYGNEDWDFYLSLLKKEDVVFRIDEVLFHYRIKETSRTTELRTKHVEESLIQLCKNHPDIYVPYQEKIIEYHHQAEENSYLKQELEKISNSRAYRFGLSLIKPFSLIKKYGLNHNMFTQK